MSKAELTPLQTRVLESLSGIEPRFVLTGGAALVAVHLKHRTTRDLDLFWRDRALLGTLVTAVRARLVSLGLEVTDLEASPSFHRLRAFDGSEACVIDLVADPAPTLEEPEPATIGRVTILIDTPREILANKLCTLLSRSELRDLQDVKALLEAGGDWDRALRDAPEKDGGFSPLTLAWVLRALDERALAEAARWSTLEIRGLSEFKAELVDRLVSASEPSRGS
jgi:hypothetical protein